MRLGPGAQRRRAGRGQASRPDTRCRLSRGGARERADPPVCPALTAKQTAALEHLRCAGKPLERAGLAAAGQVRPGPVEALVDKGLARACRPPRRPASPWPSRMRRKCQAADHAQRRPAHAWAPLEQALRTGRLPGVPAARRHRQRQDRALSAGHRGSGSAGQGSASCWCRRSA